VPLDDSSDPNSLASMLRARRGIALKGLITDIARVRGKVEILDMGGTVDYWRRLGLEFLAEVGAKVTVVNVVETQLEKVSPSPLISCAVGDACNLSQFSDLQFDLAHSNSVIEHVGTWSNMKAFAAETRRLAQSYYIQTPYFWFPIDPHYYKMPFFHWFPRPIRARLLRNLPIAHAGKIAGVDRSFQTVDDARLLDLDQFRFLFPDANIKFERFVGLPKSMIAARPV